MADKIQEILGNFMFSLAEKSQEVFWIKSADYQQQIYINPAYEEVWGLSCQSLYANPSAWINYVHPADQSAILTSLQKRHFGVSASDTYWEVYRIIRPNGEIRWISDNSYPIYDEHGEHIGFAGIAKDITKEKIAEEELRQELRIASQFLPKLADRMEKSVFWVRDPSLKRQLYLSSAFDKIWGFSSTFLYENPNAWGDTVIADDRPLRTIDNMLEMLKEKGADTRYDDVYRIKRPDGGIRWVHDISFPIFDDNNTCVGFAGIAEDITREKIYEEQLQSAKLQAETANQAKSEFLANMSHDLRSPLTSIVSTAQLLKRSFTDPKIETYFEHMVKACHNLNDLIEDILNFSKLEAGRYELTSEQFNLPRLIEDMVTLFAHQALQKNIELMVYFDNSLPTYFIGDANALRRILINLLGNAIKFTEIGHVLIKIILDRRTADEEIVSFLIEDTGIGIAEDKLDYIFERFNRITSDKVEYAGTGLGLSIVKQFTNLLGGNIKVTSKKDKGSVFTVMLPFKPSTLTIRSSKWQRHYSETHLLIVDEYIPRREILLQQLSLTNSHVIEGSEVISCLSKAYQQGAAYQILLVDEEIQAGALTIAKAIRMDKRFNNLMLILLAKPSTLFENEAARSAGYFTQFVKPILPQEFSNFLAKSWAQWLSLLNNQKDQMRAYTPSVLLLETEQDLQQTLASMLIDFGCKVQFADTAAKALERFHKNLDFIVLNLHLPDLEGDAVANLIRQHEDKTNPIPIIGLSRKELDASTQEKYIAAGINELIVWPVPYEKLFETMLRLTLNEIA